MPRHRSSIRSYLAFMLRSPLTIWWALATFTIQIALLAVQGPILVLPKLLLIPLIFIVSLPLLLAVLLLWKGWLLYSEAAQEITIHELIQGQEGHTFVLETAQDLPVGAILEVFRMMEGVEVAIGFLETTHVRDDGRVQAKPLWFGPGHVRDLRRGVVPQSSLSVRSGIQAATLKRSMDMQIEKEVRSLMRRGIE